MKKIALLLLLLIALPLYVLTIRGDWGIPSSVQIEQNLSQSGKAFETSQERSRYAIILSVVNYGTVDIDHYASMGTPDIGKLGNHYYSFFPITVSVIAIPLYLFGLLIGAPQIMVFLISTIFALCTMLLIVQFCLKSGLSWKVALFSALSFGFATNAWGYSVTLYAHLVSAFLLLTGLYCVLFWKEKMTALRNILVWMLYGIAVYVDYPNAFIFFPIAILLSLQGFSFKELVSEYKLSYRWIFVITPLIFFIMIVGYGYYNYIHFGSPMTLSNSIPRVKDLKLITNSIPEKEKNSGQALKTRNLLEGIRSFTVSYDRGILFYSPIVLLGFLGLGSVKKIRKDIQIGLIAVPATCFSLYCMFGDPYGGWAFGSRYLIAVLPMMCILAGIGLSKFSKNIFIKVLYSGIFLYSTAVALLAPLTTNVIPPFVEARNLGLDSWYIINIRMLQQDQLNSFIYNNVLQRAIPGWAYYFAILAIVGMVGISLIWLQKEES